MTTSDRWLVSIHEAAHCAVAIALGGRCNGAVLCDTGEFGGYADVGQLLPDRYVLMTAAGKAGEYLADEFDPPSMPEVVSSESIADSVEMPVEPEETREYKRALAAFDSRVLDVSISDDHSVALWAIDGHFDDPNCWADRVEFAKRVASEIVASNAELIVKIARELFIRGRLDRDDILQITSRKESEI